MCYFLPLLTVSPNESHTDANEQNQDDHQIVVDYDVQCGNKKDDE